MKKLLCFKKKEVKDIKDANPIPITQWLCKAKDNGKTYLLSIFYDTQSFKYRIVDMNKLEIHGDFSSKDDALNQIYEMSSTITCLRVYDCVNYESIG